MLITQGQSWVHLFWMVLTDGQTPATGKVPIVTISKNGQPFVPITGPMWEVGSGWYAVSGSGVDSNVLGELAYHHSASGCACPDSYKDVVIAPTTPQTFPMVVDLTTINTALGKLVAGLLPKQDQ